MHDPIKVLQAEHHALRSALHTASQIQAIKDDDLYRTRVHDIILFFREFTERYHYPKEDGILYPVLRDVVGAEVISDMYDSHEDMEQLLADIIDAHVNYDHALLRSSMDMYINKLRSQIDREDKELLEEAGRSLSPAQASKIYQEFIDLDKKDGLKEVLYKNYHKISAQMP